MARIKKEQPAPETVGENIQGTENPPLQENGEQTTTVANIITKIIEAASTDIPRDNGETPAPAQGEKGADNKATPKKSEAKENKTIEIPENALATLKIYPEEKELYVDKFGGAFSIKTPSNVRLGAVLYQNPFYNKN